MGSLVVYYHGGGWVIGNIDEYDNLGRRLANRLGAAVVLVNYRKAPEHRYPAAVEDSWAALQWAAAHMGEIAGGQVPLIVMGDSAGGNLSAVMAQRAHREGGPQLARQVLIYPVTDADLDNDTYTDPENQLLLTRESMVWFWDHYAPDPASRRNPDASPLQAADADLAGLAPAVVLTAEHDVLGPRARPTRTGWRRGRAHAGAPVPRADARLLQHGGRAAGLRGGPGLRRRAARRLKPREVAMPEPRTYDAIIVAKIATCTNCTGCARVAVIEAADGVGGTWF